jgi:hypothetical protein
MLTWIPLVIVFLFVKSGIAPAWVAVLWIINIMPGMLLSFQKDNWLSNIVPGQTMGKYLGQRLAVKSAFYLAAFFSFGFLMDSMGENNLMSFGLVFLVATVMTMIYSFIYSKMYDPKKQDANNVKAAADKIKFGLKDYLGDLKKKKLDKFIGFTALINVSVGLSAPFYAVYMLQEQSFSYMSYTIIISVEFLARIISGPFWGKFADKKGNIQVLKIVSRIVPALPLCWLFSTNIGYLAVIQILSGICWGAFDLSTQSYLYKVSPPQTKLHYIVYTRALMLFSVAMGGLAGSFLIKDIFEIFGSKLLTVFMISGFLRAFIVMFLMPKLIDLAVKIGVPQGLNFGFKLQKKAALSKHGLFYCQPETAEAVLVRPEVMAGRQALPSRITQLQKEYTLRRKMDEAEAAKLELMELTEAVRTGRRRVWAVENTVQKQVKETTPPPDVKPSRRPWFRDSEILANYQQRVPVMASAMAASGANGMNMSADKAAGRGGLFHNDTGWARYKEQSLQTYVKEKKQLAAAGPENAFIESGYHWRNTY